MHRLPLQQALETYKTSDLNEQQMYEATIQFVNEHPDCFERSLLVGHITGSAWVVSNDGTHVLLMHHKKLGRWFQPGGHCDGDPNVARVALKEAQEETGLDQFEIDDTAIFDVDVHVIPASTKAPEHLHYDIRYLFRADRNAPLKPNSESNAVAWVPLAEILQYNDSESLLRMTRKITAL